ncbi:helix-turn-helix transcriptional regulator [Streptomyces sp. NBC_01476]|uniref:helix-turn-helix transcriptional regulator n=1 Tax=Streptomyces sp. NBC_01476 TaxID=2903881 RepID=UPI002E3139F9|nr:helix-turn-helix transcriptional regulator [Streptomyces sp. NBC_01476]
MWNNHAEPLSLEQLAEAAYFSKFHYARTFTQVTGTSPGRFLAAIRLFMGKQHLLETRASVTDITYRVGYNSLGTFTSRFTQSVGISPARYRFLARCGLPPLILPTPHLDHATSTVTGHLQFPPDAGPVRVYVGAFNTPVLAGFPQSCDILDEPRPFRLHVTDGLWFIRAAAVAPHDAEPVPHIRLPRLIGSGSAIRARGGRMYRADVQLRTVTSIDLPVLLALPELDGTRSASAPAPPWPRRVPPRHG